VARRDSNSIAASTARSADGSRLAVHSSKTITGALPMSARAVAMR
jgi:hypothetical protein